jgi:hypothetical protein
MQVEAHHYCMHYNQDMRQCAIFNSPEADARLIGVEYIIDTLFDEEKKLWHSHDYEVKGGILFMPGVLKVIESRVGFSSCRKFSKQSSQGWDAVVGTHLCIIRGAHRNK